MMETPVDTEYLLRKLMLLAFPDVKVTTEPDIDAAENLPMIVIRTAGGRRVSNGPAGIAHRWSMPVTIVHSSRVGAADLALQVYKAVHKFSQIGEVIPAAGWVSHLDDVSMFSRAPRGTATAADHTYQYDGVFTVIVRK